MSKHININSQKKLDALEKIVLALVEKDYPEDRRWMMDIPINIADGLSDLAEIHEEEAKDK
jgi:hypothetical protein